MNARKFGVRAIGSIALLATYLSIAGSGTVSSALAYAPNDLTISAQATPAKTGGTFTNTIVATSHAPITLTDVNFVQDLPGSMTVVSSTGCTFNATGNCDVGSLAPGASVTVTSVISPTKAGKVQLLNQVFGSLLNHNDEYATQITDVDVADGVAPQLTQFKLRPLHLRPKAIRRAKIRYRLSEAATITFKVTKGRRTYRKLVIKRMFTDRYTLRLARLLHHRKLKPGRYRVSGIPKDAAGNVGGLTSESVRVLARDVSRRRRSA